MAGGNGGGGSPLSNATANWLDSLGDAECERRVFERLASGISTTTLTRMLSQERIEDGDGLPIVRSGIYRWKDRTPERRAAWQVAIRLQAEAWADKEGAIYKQLSKKRFYSREELKLAEMRGKHYRWLASVSDRERYGEAGNTNITNVAIDARQLHLTATRQVGQVFDHLFERRIETHTTAMIEDAEMVEDDDFAVLLGARLAPAPKRIAPAVDPLADLL